MMRHRTAPGVQHRGEADLHAEALGVRGDRQQRLGTRLEQEVVDDGLVVVGDGADLRRQREHDMGRVSDDGPVADDATGTGGRRPKASKEGKRGQWGTRLSGHYGDLAGSDGGSGRWWEPRAQCRGRSKREMMAAMSLWAGAS